MKKTHKKWGSSLAQSLAKCIRLAAQNQRMPFFVYVSSATGVTDLDTAWMSNLWCSHIEGGKLVVLYLSHKIFSFRAINIAVLLKIALLVDIYQRRLSFQLEISKQAHCWLLAVAWWTEKTDFFDFRLHPQKLNKLSQKLYCGIQNLLSHSLLYDWIFLKAAELEVVWLSTSCWYQLKSTNCHKTRTRVHYLE